jgi:Flp pilus assembly protein TadG
MLEFGLVFVPLFAIIFAISDFSMAIFMRATLQQAVREGVRYAVTYQTMSGLCQDASIKTASSGFLTSANDAIIFVRYHAPNDLTTVVTGAGSNAAGNIVEVSVEGYSYSWMAPIARSNTPLSITVTAADRNESLPQGTTTPPCR